MPTKGPRVLSRRAGDGWLGGVCAGIAAGQRTRPGWIRAAFVAATPIGGLGILAYASCWLILPGESEPAQESGSGLIVLMAEVGAVCVGLVALSACAATATLFGFGWLVVGFAAVVLLGVLMWWPRLAPAWALLPVAALTLPSLAVAASGIQLAPEIAPVTVAPSALTATGSVAYRAGLGTMLIDLRRTSLPVSGTARLRIEGGVKRTIVALPADRCVHVALDYRSKPFVAQLAAQVVGQLPLTGVEVFGNAISPRSGLTRFAQGPGAGPWLRIDFTSAGGSLYIRDYPDGVDPSVNVDWPGYRVFPESQPVTAGLPRRAARRLIAAWRVRLAGELQSQRLVNSLMPGPCAAGVVTQ